MFGYSLVSYLAVALIALLARVQSTTLLPLLGATSLGLYYWLSAPTIAVAYGFPQMGPLAIRVAVGMLLALWLASAWRSRRMFTTPRRSFN